ncbi:MAG: toprim domain-containing protein [Bacteroidia bacterium]|nr:toprim domain-containing protein [Bacteroidia bacterium]
MRTQNSNRLLKGRNFIEFRDFSKAELQFWAQFGINQETLEKFGVRSVKAYSYLSQAGDTITVRAKNEDPIFAYEAEKGVFKLYRPFNKKYKFSWWGKKKNEYVFGFLQLPHEGALVIICAGEKDTLTVNSMGYPAVCLNGETANLSPNLLFELKSRFLIVFSLYDNDKTGLEQSAKLLDLGGIKPLRIPDFFFDEDKNKKGKDISEYVQSGLPLGWLPDQIRDCLDSPEEEEVSGALSGTSKHLLTLIRSSKSLDERVKTKISFSKPIISQNDIPWIYPNTIVVIQGQTGTHKSRLVETIGSAIISHSGPENNILGLSVNRSFDYSFIYIDTERNIQEQFPYALQQIKLKAGFQIDDKVPQLGFTSLVEIPRDERVETLEAYIGHLKAISKTHLVIVLDVVTDCVLDFNRSEESMQFIQHLNRVINQNGVTFICLIHENPGHNSKARGHLGTELANKASTLIQIGFEKDANRKDTDLIRLKFLKFRQGKRPENVFLKYDEIVKGLVLADALSVQRVMDKKVLVADPELVSDFLAEKLMNKPMRKASLVNMLTKHFSISEKTARERIKQILNNEHYKHANKDKKICVLDSFKEAKQVYLKLTPTTELKSEDNLPS